MIKDKDKIIKKIRLELDKICQKYDPLWRKRSRTIDTKFMISFIFKLFLNSDKGYGIVLSDLLSEEKINTKLKKNHIASSSICEARDKFPEKIIKTFNNRVISIAKQHYSYSSLSGHRVFAIDGSKVSLAKELEKYGYKKFNKRAYYPSGLLSGLYNIDTHLVHDIIVI
jgi:hypothetical protein